MKKFIIFFLMIICFYFTVSFITKNSNPDSKEVIKVINERDLFIQ